jgi:hypothetical protein
VFEAADLDDGTRARVNEFWWEFRFRIVHAHFNLAVITDSH